MECRLCGRLVYDVVARKIQGSERGVTEVGEREKGGKCGGTTGRSLWGRHEMDADAREKSQNGGRGLFRAWEEGELCGEDRGTLWFAYRGGGHSSEIMGHILGT